MPVALWWFYGGGAFSCERGTPVFGCERATEGLRSGEPSIARVREMGVVDRGGGGGGLPGRQGPWDRCGYGTDSVRSKFSTKGLTQSRAESTLCY